MTIERNIKVKSQTHIKPILTDVFYKKNNVKKDIVVFCHGYKGYKDWGAWNLVAEEFAKNDLFFVKFNFSHNGGTVDEPIDFPDLEAFGRNNFTLELDDIDTVVEWIISNAEFKNQANFENITLVGHSRGGGIVTLKASENNKISKVISWCGVSDFGARFPSGKLLEQWELAGISYVENARTKQQMPHYFQFYTNFKENEERLTIKNAVLKMTIPQLIIYGDMDDTVLPIEAINLNKWNPKSELLMIEEMNHSMGCSQPWEHTEIPIHLAEVVRKSIRYIKNS